MKTKPKMKTNVMSKDKSKSNPKPKSTKSKGSSSLPLNKKVTKAKNSLCKVLEIQDSVKASQLSVSPRAIISSLLSLTDNELSNAVNILNLSNTNNSELGSISIAIPKCLLETLIPTEASQETVASPTEEDASQKKPISKPTYPKSKHRRQPKVFSDGNGCRR